VTVGILDAAESLKRVLGNAGDGGDFGAGCPQETESVQEVFTPVEVPEPVGGSPGGRLRFPSFSLLRGLGEKWNSLAVTIGLGFLNFWNKKHLFFPPLLAVSLLAVWYHRSSPARRSFTLAVSLLLTTLLLAFIGLVVMDYVQRDLASTGKVVTQTLVGISLLLGFLFYLDLSIGGFLPAPPLLILLAIMWAVPLVPYVVVALFLPLLVGRLPRVRERWEALRGRYPFWGIYCAVLGGLMILYVPLKFFPMYLYTSLVFWGMFLGSSCLALAAIMAMFPRRDSCRVVGLFLVILAALSWMGTLGGALLGSLFCIAAGAHAYAWRPASGS
jgi:hypothetical protein